MLVQADYDTIQIDKRPDGVAVATLNRPDRLNAVNGRMHTELSTLARDFDDDGFAGVRGAAAEYAEHTDEVLAELGYSEDEIIDLKASEAIW